jgi:hypothetical protein
MTFSDKDIKQIKSHGLSLDIVNKQIEKFKTGFPFLNIVKPASSADGVKQISPEYFQKYIDIYDKYQQTHNIVKFVPASGAATRMFKDLFDFLRSNRPNKISLETTMNITRFAFWNDLKVYLPRNATDMNIADCLVTESGLNYGNMPKALIAFHQYTNHVRTPIEEHVDEAFQYAKSGNNVNVHFTISPEHRNDFENALAKIIPEYESKYNVKYNVSLSEQKSSTDTIAMNVDNSVFRNDDYTLLFRPAGHGALIENLNDIDADMIFIKNIDNIAIESWRADTVKYKRVLAGLLVDIQNQIFALIKDIDSNNADINRIHNFITNNLGIKIERQLSLAEYRDILNRPTRVCGVVKNTGAPGGGPFWVRAPNGDISLQIVETNQIAPESAYIIAQSEYFNPVDLVCGVKDYNGNKFDLTKYVDEDTGFISEKSKNGLLVRAMELPGLWNGAMSKWNTILVDVPISTFTPVKVVTDLLLPPHQGK